MGRAKLPGCATSTARKETGKKAKSQKPKYGSRKLPNLLTFGPPYIFRDAKKLTSPPKEGVTKPLLSNTLGKCRGQSLGFVGVGGGLWTGILGTVMLYLRLKSHGAYFDYILKRLPPHQGLVGLSTSRYRTVVPNLGEMGKPASLLTSGWLSSFVRMGL